MRMRASAIPAKPIFLFDHIVPDLEDPTGWRYDRTALLSDRIFRNRHLALLVGMDGLDLMDNMLAQLDAIRPGISRPS